MNASNKYQRKVGKEMNGSLIWISIVTLIFGLSTPANAQADYSDVAVVINSHSSVNDMKGVKDPSTGNVLVSWSTIVEYKIRDSK